MQLEARSTLTDAMEIIAREVQRRVVNPHVFEQTLEAHGVE